MKHGHIVPLALVLSVSAVQGQPAELEVDGIFGECIAVYAAVADHLILYSGPDLRAERIQIPYQRDWEIPYRKAQGMTRVLRIGAATAVRADPLSQCDATPQDGNSALVPSEAVDYLYHLGEGRGQIRVRGATCSVNLNASFGAFEVVEEPEIQWWFRVLYQDGSSPGWLLHDDTQTRLAGVRC